MGRRFQTDAIDTSPRPLFARGLLRVQFEEGRESDHEGRLCYDIRMTVVKSPNPDDEGKTWFQRLFVGTDEDPQADERATQAKSYSLKLLKLMAEKCGVEFSQDTDIVLAELAGKQFLARNKPRTNDNGDTFNNLAWVYGTGERDVAAEEERGSRALNGSGKPASSRPTATATAAPAFSGVQEIEE